MAFVPPPSIIDNSSSWVLVPAPTRQELFESAAHLPVIDLKTICTMARRGIPDKQRPLYWKLLIGYLPNTPHTWESLAVTKSKEYLDIVTSVCKIQPDGTVVTGNEAHRIDVDIPRTMPSLHFYAFEETVTEEGVPVTFSKSQHALRRILHTLAKVNKGLGYVQGMNEMVGHLLFTFADGKADNIDTNIEADSFFCFQAMLTFLGDNFCRSLDFDRDSGVTHTMRTFERIFRACDPELFDYISVQAQVRPEFYAFRWCTLLLTQEFLVPDVLRIWDFLLSFGSDLPNAVFYTAVAMLIFLREEILEMTSMSQILVFLQQYPPCDIGDLLLVAQKLIDEYGFEKADYLRNATDEELEETYKEDVSKTDELIAKSNAIKEEVTEKLSGWMSSMKGWIKEKTVHASSAPSPGGSEKAFK